MGKKSSGPAPSAPDPAATAAAQAATNISTAQTNAVLGNVNQVTPDGSLTYTQSGSKFIADNTAGQTYWQGPNGEIRSSAPTRTTTAAPVNDYGLSTALTQSGKGAATGASAAPEYEPGWTQTKGYYIPSYTATQTLSEANQKIKDQTDAASLNLGTMANQQSAFLKDHLSKPVSLDNDAIEGRLMELGRKRLDPMLADRRASLETSLANQGVRLGSTAYQTAMGQNEEATNDAYNSLLLNGRQQSISEIMAERNQPLNEISALMSGSQVSQPQWAQTNMPSVPTVDYAGLVQSNYQNQMAAWQQKQASKPNVLGGLFSLGASALGNTALFSDRRLKTNITVVGAGPMNLPVYAYRYIGDATRRIGLMAQDVARVLPDAVVRIGAFLAIDYQRVKEASA